MAFGLVNAAQAFQRFIDEVFSLLICFAYIDDLLIASPEHGVQINVPKSEFGVASLTFLGHNITPGGVTPVHSRAEAIQQFPKSTTQRQLEEFLGMIYFYNRFIPHCSLLFQPLYFPDKPCRRGQSATLQWTPQADAAYLGEKKALNDTVTSSIPDGDAEISIASDA